MNHDATQSSENRAESDGHWKLWRWAIAVVVVVILVVVIQLATSGEQARISQQEGYAAALQISAQHYQAGRYQDAIDSANTALAANPDSADAYNNLALSYLGLRMYDEGVQAAQEAIRLRPGYELAENNQRWILEERANALGPPIQDAQAAEAVALLNQSMGHARAGRFAECVETASEATTLNPTLATAFNNLGFCAASLQQWDDAIRHTQEAIRLDPNLALARNNLVWMEQERVKSLAEPVQ